MAEHQTSNGSSVRGTPQSAAALGLPREGLHLRVAGTPDALPQIRHLVVEAAERSGFGEEDVAKIEMAVGEACSNIIEHAYLTQPLRQEIEVSVHQFPDRLEITILDYSTINFSVEEAPGVGLDDYIDTQRRRGLGLYIIRTFVDRVEHRFICGQGNELRLVKFFA
ncbi:MAG: ATP-binding protein [Abitibacteriaceae bacterium]|nr:ATP-binding protein [Abditibacteriaceae bacterium]MBV9864088.1 ATP-binding protein [Abditibacteriaceae bacterium]